MAFAAALLLITGVTSTSLAPASAAPVQGLTWSAGGALPSNSWQAIAYGNGLFLAVASDGAVVTSADSGATWQSAGSVPPANFSALAYGNPKGIPTWVMVTKNTKSIRTSVDNGVSHHRPRSVARHHRTVETGERRHQGRDIDPGAEPPPRAQG